MAPKAREAFKSLHGIICTYKSSGCSCQYTLSRLRTSICEELNSLDTTPARLYHEFDYSGAEVVVKSRPSYADNVLCSGPRYQDRNIMFTSPNVLTKLMSGVFVVGINENNLLSGLLNRLNFTQCFHIKGILGQATANFHINTKVLAKARYEKVSREKFEKILASYQSLTQRKMFEEYGCLLTSQAAYEIAVKGLHRPIFRGQPIIYNLKLVDFQPPHFTIEVQCLHPRERHLLNLIHNLGLNLRCYATCVSLRCIRYGCFHVQDSLVEEQWNLNTILENIKTCWNILEKNYADQIKYSSTVETVKSSTEEHRG